MQCGIKAALRDLVRRSWFWLRPEENDDVDQGHTRSRIGNCCHKRPTGICWKLACAVQPKPGLQPLSWGEHVLVAWSYRDCGEVGWKLAIGRALVVKPRLLILDESLQGSPR